MKMAYLLIPFVLAKMDLTKYRRFRIRPISGKLESMLKNADNLSLHNLKDHSGKHHHKLNPYAHYTVEVVFFYLESFDS